MNLQASLLQYSKLLQEKGFAEEASLIERMAHYEPVDVPGVPSFFRRNFDYGEGFYFGDMSKKPGVKEWREEHKGKGPNFQLKKKQKKAALDPQKAQQTYMEMSDYLHSLQLKAKEYAEKRDAALEVFKMREADEAAEAYDQIMAIMEDYNKQIDAFVTQHGKVMEQPHAEMLDQADRIVNPKEPVDVFRTLLFEKKYDEAKELYSTMSPQDKEEADKLAKRFYTASIKGFCKKAYDVQRENRTYMDYRKGKKVQYQVVYTPHFQDAIKDHNFNVQNLGPAVFEDILNKIKLSPATNKAVYGSEIGGCFIYYNVAEGDGFYSSQNVPQIIFITCTELGIFDSANVGSRCVKLDVSPRSCAQIMEESEKAKKAKQEEKQKKRQEWQQSQKTKKPELESA